MVKTKKAFTLIETIISMMVIMIVAVGSLSSMTAKKPSIEAVTLRGQYGCWYWDSSAASGIGITPPAGVSNGDLVEWYFDERTERTDSPKRVTSCSLLLDQRPAHFYILASGAGNGTNPGQVVSVYIPAISNQLDIKIGKNDALDNKTTTVSNGDQSITAAGPVSGFADFYPSNIKSCKVVNDSTSGDKINSCDLVAVTEYTEDDKYINTFRIRLNGLSEIDDYGNTQETLLSFTNLQMNGGISTTANFTNLSPDSSVVANISSSHSDSYVVINADQPPVNNAELNGTELNFEYHNSSYVPPNKLLNFKNNGINNYSTNTSSKMTKILENVSVRRESKLTTLFKALNAGGPSKNGAVLILW